MSCFSGNRKKVLYKRFFQVTELEPTGIFSLFDKCGLIGLQPRRGDTSITPYERSVVWGSTPVGQTARPCSRCVTRRRRTGRRRTGRRRTKRRRSGRRTLHCGRSPCIGMPKSPLFKKLSSPIQSALRQTHHGVASSHICQN